MAWRRTRSAALAGLLLGTLLVAPGPSMAWGDALGDATDGDPAHDIVDVRMSETGDDLRFTVRVAGAVRAPVPGMDDFRIEFKVTPGALYQPGVTPQPAGMRYVVAPTEEFLAYGVFRSGALGYVLPEQPASGSSSATWKVPKAYLDATLARRPLPGDVVSDIAVFARNLTDVDAAAMPDVRLTQDSDPGTRFYLRSGDGAMGAGRLARQAPGDDDHPASFTLVGDGSLEARWSTEPLGQDLRLRDASVALWLSPTTTTPVLASQAFEVDLYDVPPLGLPFRVAQRAEAVDPQPGVTTNLFLVPGVPQRMPFQLLLNGAVDKVLAGHRLELRASVHGAFVEQSGPLVVWFDDADYDSFVLVGKKPFPRPDHSACPKDHAVPMGQNEHLPKPHC